MKLLVKKFLDFIGIDKHIRNRIRRRINGIKIYLGIKKIAVYNVNKTDFSKRCLLAYIIQPFLDREISCSHQNQWRAIEIARIIGTFEYNVDVALCAPDINKYLKYKYDLIIDITIRGKLFWHTRMNQGCRLVSYITGSSFKFTCTQERKRYAELEQRRGCKLALQRTSDISKLADEQNYIEKLDALWCNGNSYNIHSFDCYKIPHIFPIMNNGYVFDWVRTDIVRNKRNFIFFGSVGQVHKGLDLLLEIFGREDCQYNLYVCGHYMRERDFCNEYRHELFECPNIFPMGFVSIKSEEFRNLTEKCAYMLMPSCAEARAGSVLTMMSAGVIPIVSRECGYDDDEVINLPDCRLETIERYIDEYSQKPDEWVTEHSRKYLEIARTRYSRENVSRSIYEAMAGTLKA